MSRPGPKKKYVDTRWTAELAYVVGIFASDGNLGKDGMYLDVTSVDLDMLNNVKRILNLKNIKIGTKSSGKGTSAYRIQFKRKMLHEWFQSIGLTPNKSKTIGKLQIPDMFFFDFLRGVWDGDGCIYAYFDPRWKSSYMYYISFVSASNDFIAWIQESVIRLIGISGHITVDGRKIQQIKFAKKETRILFDSMFYTQNVSHLPRKFAKAQKIFRIDVANDKKRLASK